VFDEPGDHAGELETAAVLHVAPHLVADRDTWGDGAARVSVLDGVREGWAWLPRRWTQVTADTGVGNPQAATADRGARYVAQAVERIAALCEQLLRTPDDAFYVSAASTSD
jgi:creatinine amidohydrolase